MNDLVIRITGAVSESNFEQFKASALAEIKAANKALVTDTDFAEAEITVKSCKATEQAITKAKAEAMNQTVDIRTLFSSLDELSGELAKTRLALEKQIKVEKERRKQDIIDAGISQVEQAIKEAKDANADLLGVSLVVDGATIRQAVVGKKTIDGMKKAVDGIVEFEINRIQRLANMATLNMDAIVKCEAEFPGIFPDRKSLCLGSAVEVSAIIEARVANAKLAQAELLKRKEAEMEAKAKAEREDEEKAKAAAEMTTTEPAPVEDVVPPSVPQPVAPEPVEQQTPTTLIPIQQEENKPYYFRVDLLCSREAAIMFAEDLVAYIGENPAVVGRPVLKVREIG
jgi:hypothetical protein